MPPGRRDACVIDTHAWVWVITGSESRLGRAAHRLLGQVDVVFVPATCQWEVAQLVADGRIGLSIPVLDWINLASTQAPFVIAPLTAEIAVESVALGDEGFHRDPGDRMIYATARILRLPLITRDDDMREFEKSLGQRVTRHVVWS